MSHVFGVLVRREIPSRKHQRLLIGPADEIDVAHGEHREVRRGDRGRRRVDQDAHWRVKELMEGARRDGVAVGDAGHEHRHPENPA